MQMDEINVRDTVRRNIIITPYDPKIRHVMNLDFEHKNDPSAIARILKNIGLRHSVRSGGNGRFHWVFIAQLPHHHTHKTHSPI